VILPTVVTSVIIITETFKTFVAVIAPCIREEKKLTEGLIDN